MNKPHDKLDFILLMSLALFAFCFMDKEEKTVKIFKGICLCVIVICVTFVAYALLPSTDLLGSFHEEGRQPASCVKITVEGRGGGYGSGVLVRADLVLTAHHVIRDARADSQITVTFRDGLTRSATVEKTDKKEDLAALRIGPVIVPSARPAKRAAIIDQAVVICGFPKGDEYVEARGKVVEFLSPTRNGKDTLFAVKVKTTSGMSGGPVYNARDELVGTLFGCLAKAHCTGLDAIKAFLRDVR